MNNTRTVVGAPFWVPESWLKWGGSYCQIWCMGIKPRSCLIDPVLARRP
jgi:hypothetical protein